MGLECAGEDQKKATARSECKINDWSRVMQPTKAAIYDGQVENSSKVREGKNKHYVKLSFSVSPVAFVPRLTELLP